MRWVTRFTSNGILVQQILELKLQNGVTDVVYQNICGEYIAAEKRRREEVSEILCLLYYEALERVCTWSVPWIYWEPQKTPPSKQHWYYNSAFFYQC